MNTTQKALLPEPRSVRKQIPISLFNINIVRHWPALLRYTAVAALVVSGATTTTTARGQGTITFNQMQMGYAYKNYYERGFWFRVVAPGNQPPAASMWPEIRITPEMAFGQNGTNQIDYVSFSLTGGGTFGLVSVDLDSVWPGTLSVQFNAFREDGSTASTVFTVGPYQWLTTYQFGSDFSSGLVRIDIPSPLWEMDNLVFTVPEPGVGTLAAIGLLALAAQRIRGRIEWVRVRS